MVAAGDVEAAGGSWWQQGTWRQQGGCGGTSMGATDTDDEWTWETSHTASYTLPIISFTGALSGPAGIAVGVTDPLQCFHLFLPPELYDDILQQTNLCHSTACTKRRY